MLNGRGERMLPPKQDVSERFDLRYNGEIVPMLIHVSYDGTITFKDKNNDDIDMLTMMDDKDFKKSFTKCINMFDSAYARNCANMWVAMHVDKV
jgi:hypothetical protein